MDGLREGWREEKFGGGCRRDSEEKGRRFTFCWWTDLSSNKNIKEKLHLFDCICLLMVAYMKSEQKVWTGWSTSANQINGIQEADITSHTCQHLGYRRGFFPTRGCILFRFFRFSSVERHPANIKLAARTRLSCIMGSQVGVTHCRNYGNCSVESNAG